MGTLGRTLAGAIGFAGPILLASGAMADITPAIRADLAPTGKLRAAINYGNFILATKDRASGESRGVAVDLAQELGRRLGVPIEIVAFDSVAVMGDAAPTGVWDIAFLGSDPQREALMSFTAAYLEIEATYLVPGPSPLRTAAEVDRDGVRVAAPARANYELFLSRNLKHAQLVSTPGGDAAFDLLVTGKVDALAGLTQALHDRAQQLPGSRIVEGRFMGVQQSIAVPRGRDAGLAYAWTRLCAALLLSAIGGVGMWSVIVALPAVQAEFGVARSAAALPYTMTMICFGFGGIMMGRLSDRFGIIAPVAGGAICLGIGYAVASQATSLWQFILAQGLLVGVASSATFAPIIADTSLWFTRHRGMAVAIIASGSYLAGTIWPPVVQHFIQSAGWRRTYLGIAVFCVATMVPLALALRRRSPLTESSSATSRAGARSSRPLGMSPAALQTVLIVAGVSCCVAMSMPQVHIVAYCSDLGHGAARGAQMLSLMLGFGIVSRLASGWISDHI